MNKLKYTEGMYYTQNADIPIEQRVFFKEAVGITATSEYYRYATQEELDEWEKYKNKELWQHEK